MNNIMDKKDTRPKFEFTDHFNEKFEKAMKLYQTALDQLNKAVHSSADCEYGYCSNKYAVRLITPNDISTFTSNLVKSFRIGMLEYNIDDMQKFAVESVYRFLEEHGDTPFDETNVLGAFTQSYVDVKDFMLDDLLTIAHNEVFPTCLKSNYEIGIQKMNIKADLKKVNDLHFSGVMKNIVKALPGIIDKDPVWQLSQPLKASAFTRILQSFIIFAVTLNTITICGMKNYVVPKSSYNTKSDEESTVTECCLLQTDTRVFRSKIPFGCNFRELVLADMTPDFHDVASALYYIIKNPKSPIAQLLIKYVNLNTICDIPGASSIVPMLLKHKCDTFKQPGDSWINQKTGQRTYEDPYEVADFHTDVNWLDKLVYGDLFYDGNYRRDNPGNQATHPILNTLDTIYHIYGDKHLSKNEEIANHIINVGNVMLGIISAYKNNEIDDNQITKDILAVLGEILTRCILKLYHNNTLVVDNSDSMPNTMIPGYLYTESFVMEVDDQQPNSGQGENKANTAAKPQVNVVGRDNNTLQNKAKNISMKLQGRISALIRWIHDQLANIAPKFLNMHRLEITWVKNNKPTNEEIAGALKAKNFNITVNNFPMYNINLEKIRHLDVDAITNLTNSVTDAKTRNIQAGHLATDLFIKALPQDLRMKIDPQMSDEQMKQEVENFVLYDKQQQTPQNNNQAMPVDDKMFLDLCENILEAENALKQLKPISDSLTKAADALKKRIETQNQQQGQNQQQNGNNPQQDSQGLTDAEEALMKLANIYAATAANVISNKFYKESYSVYRDIVQAYKQEGTPNSKPNENQNNGGGNNAQ